MNALKLLLLSRSSSWRGPELVTNGGFDADASWSKGTGWAIGSGVATKTAGGAGTLQQAIAIVAGRRYEVIADINVTAGTNLTLRLGNSAVALYSYTSNGTITAQVVAGSADSMLNFTASATIAGTIDNVSVKQVR